MCIMHTRSPPPPPNLLGVGCRPLVVPPPMKLETASIGRIG